MWEEVFWEDSFPWFITVGFSVGSSETFPSPPSYHVMLCDHNMWNSLKLPRSLPVLIKHILGVFLESLFHSVWSQGHHSLPLVLIHVKTVIFPFSKAVVKMWSFCKSPTRWRVLWENKASSYNWFLCRGSWCYFGDFFFPLSNLLEGLFLHLLLLSVLYMAVFKVLVKKPPSLSCGCTTSRLPTGWVANCRTTRTA